MFMLTTSIPKHTQVIQTFTFQHKLNKPKHNTTTQNPQQKVNPMTENYQTELVQRIIKNLLDVQLLRMVQAQPLWGYKIKKKVEANFNVKLRHGALYPMLNKLEQQGFLTSQRQTKGGRARKVYTITKDGKTYLQSYYSILKNQIGDEDLK
jgi:DNA-binding PadR family transcriptional regulator